MSEELRELLGQGDEAAALVSGGNALEVEESPTVLKTDRWTKRTGERLAAEWAEAGVDGMTTGEGEGAEIAPGAANLAADAIETLLASAPTMHERPADPKRAQWWKQLIDSPEVNALRARTVLNPAVAELAAASLASQYAAYAEETKDDEPKNPEDESPREAMKRIRSVREALKEAGEAADEAEAVGAGLAIETHSRIGAKQIAQYTRRLRKSSNLLNIMRMAGRFIAKAAQLQRQRTDLPGMEITGVELSGDVSRLLPYESALVAGAVPELELLAMSRLVQRRSLSYRRITRAPVAMGPIVVSVDESGSMHGSKIESAKGIALAMASIARAQKRPFMLMAYSNHQATRVAEPTPEGIVDWCEQFIGGGSDLDIPLESVRPHWPKGRLGAQADHIIIGDAEITAATPAFLGDYTEWAKKNKIRTFSIIIGQHKPGALGAVSDGGCWCLKKLDLDNPAIDAILSIGPTHTEVR